MKSSKKIEVTKASGIIVPYSEQKLRTSLQKAGANDNIINTILNEIQLKLYSGISTKKIYRMAFNMLKKNSGHLAARYHLKRGIMELGPSGYPFEMFIGEILRHQGYEIIIGEITQGKCVSHEIDVIAKKNNHHFMIECKYHNQQGTVSDVKVPLYIQSRFKDVEYEWLKLPEHSNKIHQGWVVTNTKFSSDAIKYGSCAGLHLLSWDYPSNDSLKKQIDTLGLYPITCLTLISKVEKQKLLNNKIVLAKKLLNDPNEMNSIGISFKRQETIMNEIRTLCKGITIEHGK